LRILFVIHTPKNPFTAVYSLHSKLQQFLKDKGHQNYILAPEDFKTLNRFSARLLPLLYPFCVAWWLKRQSDSYDLVVFHSYSGWVVNLLRSIVPAYKRLKTITSFHGLEPLYYSALKEEMEANGRSLTLRYTLVHGKLMTWLIRLSCRRSDLVLCLNSEEQSYIMKQKWADQSKIMIHTNGVPQQFFVSRDHPDRARKLLFVGQWQEMKGTKYLVEAFKLLAREFDDLELNCVGTLTVDTKVLSGFPEELRSRVQNLSNVSHAELSEIYKNSDIFILPTLSEGFSQALLEAMASGTPIVTTPVGASHELLRDGVNAFIVSKRDPVALADSIRRLIESRELRKQMGHEAQTTAAQYELGKVHQRTLSILETTLQ
jgi:glycosyltransferase involved in cell wall biosynthesis